MDILVVLAVFVCVCGLMLFLKSDNAVLNGTESVPEDSMLRRHFYTELESKRQALKG